MKEFTASSDTEGCTLGLATFPYAGAWPASGSTEGIAKRPSHRAETQAGGGAAWWGEMRPYTNAIPRVKCIMNA